MISKSLLNIKSALESIKNEIELVDHSDIEEMLDIASSLGVSELTDGVNSIAIFLETIDVNESIYFIDEIIDQYEIARDTKDN